MWASRPLWSMPPSHARSLWRRATRSMARTVPSTQAAAASASKIRPLATRAAPAGCAASKKSKAGQPLPLHGSEMRKFAAGASSAAQKPKFGGLGVCWDRSPGKFNGNSVFPQIFHTCSVLCPDFRTFFRTFSVLFPYFRTFSVLFLYFFRISVLFPYFFRTFSAAIPCGISVFPYFFRTFSVLFPPSVSAADFEQKMGFRAAALPQNGQRARPVA